MATSSNLLPNVVAQPRPSVAREPRGESSAVGRSQVLGAGDGGILLARREYNKKSPCGIAEGSDCDHVNQDVDPEL